MKVKKYIKWLLVSLTVVMFTACGGGGDSGTTEAQIEVTYPESGDIVAQAKDANSDDKMDYYETKISNNIKGNLSEFIFNEDEPHELVVGDTIMTFLDNPDETIDYAFYVDGVSQFEEFGVEKRTLQLQRQFTKSLSDDECSAIKADLKNRFLELKDEVVGEANQSSVMLFYVSRTKWYLPEPTQTQQEEVKDILTQALLSMVIFYPDYHALIMRYKSECMGSTVPGDSWVRPYFDFDFIFDIDQDLNTIHDNIYSASLCPGSNDGGLLAFGNTTCTYENNILTWEHESYDKGYSYGTYIYFNDGAESIHKYGESASLSASRTYSLDIYFHDNKHPSSITVTHLTDGLIFSESYDEDGKLIKACQGSYDNCTWY